MSVITPAEATVYHHADNRWHSFVSPRSGSDQLCAWRIDIPAGTRSTPHRVNREEVLYVLTGTLTVTLAGVTGTAEPGDAVFIPVDTLVRVDNLGDQPASAWVTTGTGFQGTFEDGTVFVPEWVQ